MQANLVEISHWRFGLAVEHQLTLADAWWRMDFVVFAFDKFELFKLSR